MHHFNLLNSYYQMAKKRIRVVNVEMFAFFDVSQGANRHKSAIFAHSISAIGHTIMRQKREDGEQSMAQRFVQMLQKAWQRHGIIPIYGGEHELEQI